MNRWPFAWYDWVHPVLLAKGFDSVQFGSHPEESAKKIMPAGITTISGSPTSHPAQPSWPMPEQGL